MDYYGINELPETYKRYKTFTNDFEKWLMKTAKKRGLEIAAQAEAAAKAAAAKLKRNVAQAIASSGMPLEDVSGLDDLRDAIRTRKEVTEFYRHHQMSDETHPFFVRVLEQARQVLNDIFFASKDGDKTNDHTRPQNGKESSAPTGIAIILTLSNDLGDIDDSEDDAQSHADQSGETVDPDKRLGTANDSGALPQLTAAEVEMDEDFQVLCFLYDLYQLRQRIRQVWRDWLRRKIGTMTAAVISDLALGIVQQRVSILAEDLKDDASTRKIIGIVHKLCLLIPEDQRRVGFLSDEVGSTMYPPELLCYDAIHYMDRYWHLESKGVGVALKFPSQESFILRFLFHFKLVKTSGLRLATMDKFTESFCSQKARSELWLPFGLQLLLDIQQYLNTHLTEVKVDLLDQGIHIAECMQAHMVYEDEIWDTNRPDYMSIGDFKFSNVYLPTLEQLLDSHKQLLAHKLEDISNMASIVFLAVHPILSGLTMWFYHRVYHRAAKVKVAWFVIGLAHLYNACRVVGGLDIEWPDLEFIIQSQGASRIYVGSPPTEPHRFCQRLLVALGGSTRKLAKDFRGNHRNASRIGMSKRGLASYTPLEKEIVKYYGAKAKAERSTQLHNLFVFLQKDLDKTSVEASNKSASPTTPKTRQHQDKIRLIFSTIANKRALKTKNRKARKKNRAKIPDFSKMDSIHERLLAHAASQMADQELYSNFDHLSFFRRAYNMLTRIRREVLWDNSQALTIESSPEPPHDFQLLYDLFFDLADKRQKNHEDKRKVALENLQKISAILRESIQTEGNAEILHAEEQLQRRREHGTVPPKKKPKTNVAKEVPCDTLPPCGEPVTVPKPDPTGDVIVEFRDVDGKPEDTGNEEIIYPHELKAAMMEAGVIPFEPSNVEDDDPARISFGDIDVGSKLDHTAVNDSRDIRPGNYGNAMPEPLFEEGSDSKDTGFGDIGKATFKPNNASSKLDGYKLGYDGRILPVIVNDMNMGWMNKIAEAQALGAAQAEAAWAAQHGAVPVRRDVMPPAIPNIGHENARGLGRDTDINLHPAVALDKELPVIHNAEPQTVQVESPAVVQNGPSTLHDKILSYVNDGDLSPVVPKNDEVGDVQVHFPTPNQAKMSKRAQAQIEDPVSMHFSKEKNEEHIEVFDGLYWKNLSFDDIFPNGAPDHILTSTIRSTPAPKFDVKSTPNQKPQSTVLLLGIYHTLVYRSTRSTRDPYSFSPTVRRNIFEKAVIRRTPLRLVGARKRRISHRCYGCCYLGREMLGGERWWREHATEPEDDEWETYE